MSIILTPYALICDPLYDVKENLVFLASSYVSGYSSHVIQLAHREYNFILINPMKYIVMKYNQQRKAC